MPSREYHTKRRTGCHTCKRRKVRCTQEQPTCQNCIRLKLDCSYPSTILAPYKPSPPVRAPVPADEPGPGVFAIPPGHVPMGSSSLADRLDVGDIELMHHYTTSTCFDMGEEVPEFQNMWQVRIPRHAFANQYLLHGILAMSAVHRFHIGDRSDPSLLNVARRHQKEALRLYIPMIDNIDQQNCHSLFALAVILGALSFTFLQHAELELVGAPFIEYFMDSVDVAMGCVTVARQAVDWIMDGDLLPLIKPEFFEEVTTKVSAGRATNNSQKVYEALVSLFDASVANEGMALDDPASVTYKTSLDYLAVALPRRGPGGPSVNHVFRWLLMSGSRFAGFVREQQPLALIMVSVYGAVLRDNQHIWFTHGLGDRLVQAVADTIDSSWSQSLYWVMSLYNGDV